MNAVCELDDFFIRNLEINGIDRIEAAAIAITGGFDYDLFCHDKNCRQIRMVFRAFFGPDKDVEPRTCPYEIKATIEGFFTFKDDLNDKQMAYLVRVNSASILYGILRGEIANITGSFPAGKFLLPTVMMQDVVKEIEERKATDRKAKATKPAKAAKLTKKR